MVTENKWYDFSSEKRICQLANFEKYCQECKYLKKMKAGVQFPCYICKAKYGTTEEKVPIYYKKKKV